MAADDCDQMATIIDQSVIGVIAGGFGIQVFLLDHTVGVTSSGCVESTHLNTDTSHAALKLAPHVVVAIETELSHTPEYSL